MFKDPFTQKKGKNSNPLFAEGLDFGLNIKKSEKPKREPIARSQKNEILAN